MCRSFLPAFGCTSVIGNSDDRRRRVRDLADRAVGHGAARVPGRGPTATDRPDGASVRSQLVRAHRAVNALRAAPRVRGGQRQGRRLGCAGWPTIALTDRAAIARSRPGACGTRAWCSLGRRIELDASSSARWSPPLDARMDPSASRRCALRTLLIHGARNRAHGRPIAAGSSQEAHERRPFNVVATAVARIGPIMWAMAGRIRSNWRQAPPRAWASRNRNGTKLPERVRVRDDETMA